MSGCSQNQAYIVCYVCACMYAMCAGVSEHACVYVPGPDVVEPQLLPVKPTLHEQPPSWLHCCTVRESTHTSAYTSGTCSHRQKVALYIHVRIVTHIYYAYVDTYMYTFKYTRTPLPEHCCPFPTGHEGSPATDGRLLTEIHSCW